MKSAPVRSLSPDPKPSRAKSRYPRWVMKNGKKVRIEDMSDAHVINTIRMLERNARSYQSEALISAFAVYSWVEGEMGKMAIEQDIENLMDGDEGLSFYHPAYHDFLDEASRRGLII